MMAIGAKDPLYMLNNIKKKLVKILITNPKNIILLYEKNILNNNNLFEFLNEFYNPKTSKYFLPIISTKPENIEKFLNNFELYTWNDFKIFEKISAQNDLKSQEILLKKIILIKENPDPPEWIYKFILNLVKNWSIDSPLNIYIIKASFILKNNAHEFLMEIFSKHLEPHYLIILFESWANIKPFLNKKQTEELENISIKLLKNTKNFLLFKNIAYCLKDTKKPEICINLFNLLNMNPPYSNVIIEIIKTLDFSNINPIINILKTIFNNKKLINNKKSLFEILYVIKKTNSEFKQKLRLLLKDQIKTLINYEKIQINDENPKANLILNDIINYFKKNPDDKELMNETKKILKLRNENVLAIVLEKYKKLINKNVPFEYRKGFFNIISLENQHKKISLLQKIENIIIKPNKQIFLDILLILDIINEFGDTSFYDLIILIKEHLSNEHLKAKLSNIIGNLRIKQALPVLETYINDNKSFTLQGTSIISIAKINKNNAYSIIKNFLNSNNEWLKIQAIKAMNYLDHIESNKMIEMFKKENSTEVKYEIIKILCKFNLINKNNVNFFIIDLKSTNLILEKYNKPEVLNAIKENPIVKKFFNENIVKHIKEIYTYKYILNAFPNHNLANQLITLCLDNKIKLEFIIELKEKNPFWEKIIDEITLNLILKDN